MQPRILFHLFVHRYQNVTLLNVRYYEKLQRVAETRSMKETPSGCNLWQEVRIFTREKYREERPGLKEMI
jgi:hypothetical protein